MNILPTLGHCYLLHSGDKIALSMVSSGGAVNQPQLTSEPYPTPGKVTNISQWFTVRF